MIEDEFVGGRSWYFSGDGVPRVLEINFTRELDFEGQIDDVEGIGIDLDFPFDRHPKILNTTS